MFKRFLLSAVPPEQIVRELHSSATGGQQPSRIVVDKTTAFRQARALVAILKEHVGAKRRPLLVLDAAESAGAGEGLSARGAAIRGLGAFASETTFAMRLLPGGALEADWDAVETFCARHGDEAVLLFGFTYIVWTDFVLEAERRGRRFRIPQAVLLHSGGWKKLSAQAVTKEEFSRRAGAVLGAARGRSWIFTAWWSKWGRCWSIARPATNMPPPSPTSSFAVPTRWRPPGRARRASSRC